MLKEMKQAKQVLPHGLIICTVTVDYWILMNIYSLSNLKLNCKELQTSYTAEQTTLSLWEDWGTPGIGGGDAITQQEHQIAQDLMVRWQNSSSHRCVCPTPLKKSYSKYMNKVQPQEPPVSIGIKSITSSHSHCQELWISCSYACWKLMEG